MLHTIYDVIKYKYSRYLQYLHILARVPLPDDDGDADVRCWYDNETGYDDVDEGDDVMMDADDDDDGHALQGSRGRRRFLYS